MNPLKECHAKAAHWQTVAREYRNQREELQQLMAKQRIIYHRIIGAASLVALAAGIWAGYTMPL